MREDAKHAGAVACAAQAAQKAAKAAKREAKRKAKALGEEVVEEAGERVGDDETPLAELARHEAEITKEAGEDAATDAKYSRKWRNVRAGI